jgi:hypothetical protein
MKQTDNKNERVKNYMAKGEAEILYEIFCFLFKRKTTVDAMNSTKENTKGADETFR